ncbi:MerR family transcriptional regulator [Paenibacillus sp. BSR1-1]|uniref:MerR family transcriptional regulator n=1 Tax=Paenibacillus sp. BSR1-1 TaxID=3020845 RepID=UPI0025B132A9|nr:MerR family transcriptional regulator [Paenibacillus sp. BSR1-1]MDN3019615.1 MerR family transcriptional regulator [Paenibacillus sp. BSR1-1]
MTVKYSPADVQELLVVDSNTLRKYATLLEGHGYHVHRNNRGHRCYYENDVITLRKLIDFCKQEGMTLEQAAEAVMVWVSQESKTTVVTEVVPVETTIDQDKELVPIEGTNDKDMEHDSHHAELMERIEHLEQINLDLIKHLKEKAILEARQEEKLNEIMKYVKRAEQLEVERYKVIEETKMQIAATRQKKWWQWWK